MDKKTILKMSGAKNLTEFYRLYPDEKSFMAKHGKQLKKALLGEQIKKAQQGGEQPFNQQNAGMSTIAATQADVQDAVSNIGTGVAKKTVGQSLSEGTKDIPILGSLVSGISGLFDAGAERKRQVRAGALSDLQLRASQSAPREQNRRYNRPDLDANVNDINSLAPAEGTGTNLLGRDGITLSRGGEITNTFAPNTIYTNGGYEPLSDSDRMKIYYNGGEIPKADWGSILSSVLSSSGKSGGGGGIGGLLGGSGGGSGGGIMGMVSSLLGSGGGNQTTAETTTLDPSQYIIRNNFSQNYVRKAQAGDWIKKILGSAGGNTGNVLSNMGERTLPSEVGNIAANAAGNAIGTGVGSTGGIDKMTSLPTYSNNIPPPTAQPNKYKSSINNFAKNVSAANDAIPSSGIGFNASAIPGMNSKMAQSSKQIGETVGSVIPLPGASQVLGLVAEGIGRIAENKSGEKAMARIQRNNQQMAITQAARVNQSNQQGYMRTGGHLKQNSPDMEADGELKTLWGGHSEPISYNPYLPDGGETVMFRGNSHEESSGGRTGIGVRYGEGGDLQPYDANVEVERGEPAVQMPDETGEKNLVVFGNLPIPNQFVKQLGDPDAKGKKFKNYVALLSKQENKQNKIVEKANSELTELNPKTPYDKIKFDTLGIMLNGANMKLKDLADKKNNAAHLQQAINDTAEERGIDPEYLAKGTIKAIKGANVPKAQTGARIVNAQDGSIRYYYPDGTFGITTGNLTVTYDAKGHEILRGNTQTTSDAKPTPEQIVGTNANKKRPTGYPPTNKLPDFGDLPKMSSENYNKLHDLFQKAQSTKNKSDILAFQQAYEELAPDYKKRVDSAYPKMKSNNKDGIMGERTIQYGQSLQDPGVQRMTPRPGEFNLSSPPPDIKPIEAGPLNPEKPKRQMPQFINPMGNYLPPNKEELDPRQLTGEYYALATNQLEPVPAQQYHPNLRTPYEISLQDILNENTATTRGAQRMMGYNPAAQANLVAQQYGANQKVLGDQFRINQEMKDKVYGENTNILNDTQLKNLGILDQQYQRQAKALSNTKDTAREALSSISDKYMKNKLENDTNAVYQNLYNYRYDPNGHAWNMNGPAQWNMQGNGASDQSAFASMPEDAKNAYYYDWKEKEAKKAAKTTVRNGAILKAMKNL